MKHDVSLYAAVDTVCSSSLVSTHLACRALAAGDCDEALSAGVNLLLVPRTTGMCQAAGMLSLDGRCKALDAAADRYGRAEAAGALLLAPVPLSQTAEDALAVEDGNERRHDAAPIALLAGTAVNQDGRSSSLTTPNGPAQQVCVCHHMSGPHGRVLHGPMVRRRSLHGG